MESKSNDSVVALKAHLALNVVNVERSIQFYRKMFGIEPSKVRRGYAKFDVQNPPINFVLNEVAYTEGGTLSHLGIQVESTDDVLKTRERWVESGLLTVDEMKVDCCYALQDKTWARDPDGNEWEVFVVLENTEPGTTSCDCGEKVAHSELTSLSPISTSTCCTPNEKATTIAATNSPCC